MLELCSWPTCLPIHLTAKGYKSTLLTRYWSFDQARHCLLHQWRSDSREYLDENKLNKQWRMNPRVAAKITGTSDLAVVDLNLPCWSESCRPIWLPSQSDSFRPIWLFPSSQSDSFLPIWLFLFSLTLLHHSDFLPGETDCQKSFSIETLGFYTSLRLCSQSLYCHFPIETDNYLYRLSVFPGCQLLLKLSDYQ